MKEYLMIYYNDINDDNDSKPIYALVLYILAMARLSFVALPRRQKGYSWRGGMQTFRSKISKMIKICSPFHPPPMFHLTWSIMAMSE